jgi:hypothetical protein
MIRGTRTENAGISCSLFAGLREEGFCLQCNMHCCVYFPLAPNNVPQPTANAEYVGWGKGEEKDSQKLLFVLQARGQKKYDWN